MVILYNLNVSGATYCYGHLFAQQWQNVYGQGFFASIWLSLTKQSKTYIQEEQDIEIYAVGGGALICNVSRTSRMMINNNNNVSIDSSLNVSGATTLNNNTSIDSLLNVSGSTALNNITVH